MSKYIEKLAQILGSKYNFEVENYKLSWLVGKQKWVKVSVDDYRSINTIFLGKAFPVFGILDENEGILRLLDLGNEYETWVDKRVVWETDSLSNPTPYMEGKFLYYNYRPLGKMKMHFKNFYYCDDKIMTDIWKVYKLELSFWVSDLKVHHYGEVSLALFLEPLKFVRKGIYFEHEIPPNSDKITTSFLAKILKLTWVMARALRINFYKRKLFANKFKFLNFYEREFFAQVCRSELNVDYKPRENIEDSEVKIRLMIDFLKNNKDFVKKAKNEGCLNELNTILY